MKAGMARHKRASYVPIALPALSIIILLLFSAFYYFSSRETSEVVIEAEDMYNRNGAIIPEGVSFFGNGFVSKDVKIPSSWIGKNMQIRIVARADKYLLEPPARLDWSYNVTATLLDGATISDVLSIPESQGSKLLNVRMDLRQKNGLSYSFMYAPTPNYSEAREYIMAKQNLAKEIRANGPIKMGDANKTLTGIEFGANTITSFYEWHTIYYPKYAVVPVVINERVVDRLAIDSEEWSEYSLHFPVLANETSFTVEIDYIDDLFGYVSRSNSSQPEKFDRNFHIDKIILKTLD